METKRSISRLLLFLILSFTLLLRLFLYKNGTYSLDVNTFISWSDTLFAKGFRDFYANAWCDYLPGYLYVLWFLGWLKNNISFDTLLIYKFPAIVADVVTGFIIFKIVSNLKNSRWGLIASSLYLFNPAILSNSTLWGQVDSVTALFSLLSVWLVNINPLLSLISLSLGTLIKPQAGFVAPVILITMLKNRWGFKKIAIYALASFLIFVLGFIPFSDKNLFPFIYERIISSFNQYPYTSVNAFNFWGFWGFWNSDKETVPLNLVGFMLSLVFVLFSVVKLANKKNSKYLLTSIIFSTTFLFMTRMHERHLLPLFAPLVISAFLVNIKLLIPYFGLSLTYVANLYYSFQIIEGKPDIFSKSAINEIIFLNLIFWGFIIISIFKNSRSFFKVKALFPKMFMGFPRINLSESKIKFLIVLILSFSFLTRFLWLGSPSKEYFDEVYHAFTARTMLRGDPKAWEWWNTPPEGFAYEWTHPPLAKLGMVLGMKIFGENSFGWRSPGAFLGVASVFLVYLITKELFKDRIMALISSGIFALDGLSLVMSRIAMNDIYFLFFSLLSIYLFIKSSNFFSALALGLAFASKWSTLWTLPILVIFHFVLKKKFSLGYVWFLILPPLVYLATYVPMFTSGHTFDQFIEVQRQMWWYHTNLRATHAYTSPWWSWPIMVRPVYLYTSNVVGGFVSRIYLIGNPFIFWLGLVSMTTSVYSVINARLNGLDKKGEFKKSALIIFSYLVVFIPWSFSPRIMFLYHYLPAIPFLAISMGYILRRYTKLITPVFVLLFIIFLYFYPHWAGISIPLWLDNSYYWFSSWR